jgi:serine/threonine-protein kinase
VHEGHLLDGRYRLTSQIAADGTGQSWRAVDERMVRDVAVRLLPDLRGRDGDEEVLARFADQARTAGRLAHPAILAVHDFGRGDLDGVAVPYLVTEPLDGATADVLVDQAVAAGTPVPLREALRWTAEVCAALDSAHRTGVVHGDLRPSRVLLTPDGGVKVTDFGMARFVEDEHTRRGLTAVLGSAEYMAPEQAGGGVAEARSDLYSVGCVLYFLLIGRPPFQGDSFLKTARMHLDQEPEAPSKLRPEVPADVDRLVLGLLAKNPAARPQDAASVRAAVTAMVEAMPAGGFGAAATVAAVAATAPSVAAAPPVGRPPLAGPPAAAPPVTVPAWATATPEQIATAPFSPKDYRIPGVPPNVVQNWQSGAPAPRRRGLLIGLSVAGGAAVLGGIGVAAWALSGNSKPSSTPGALPDAAGGSTGLPAAPITARGTSAPASPAPAVQAHPSPTLLGTITADDAVGDLSFHPSGKYLAFSTGTARSPEIWNVADPKNPHIFVHSAASDPEIWKAAAFSPNGDALYLSRVDGITAWSGINAGGTLSSHATSVVNDAKTFAVARGGRLLACDGYMPDPDNPGFTKPAVKIFTLGDPTRPSLVATLPETGSTYCAISPDGRVVATGSGNGHENAESAPVQLWTLADPKNPVKAGTIAPGDEEGATLVFSPDGKRLAVSAFGALQLFDVSDPKNPRKLFKVDSEGGKALAYHPDGRFLAAGAIEGVAIWDISNPQAPAIYTTVAGQNSPVTALAYSPDGSLLVSADEAKAIKIWKAA